MNQKPKKAAFSKITIILSCHLYKYFITFTFTKKIQLISQLCTLIVFLSSGDSQCIPSVTKGRWGLQQGQGKFPVPPTSAFSGFH